MRKNIKKLIQWDWLLILGWFLWLGAYAHELGAEQQMREIVLINPQLLYWVATIGTYFIGSMIVIQLVYRVTKLVKRKPPTEKTIDEIIESMEEQIERLKELKK